MQASADIHAPALHCRLLVVAGGKGGVGTTTIALNLAAMLSARGTRTLLVDAPPRRGDIAAMCGIDERENVADVLSGRRTVREVMQRGPHGLWLLPGGWSTPEETLRGGLPLGRLVNQLRSSGEFAQLVLVDVGAGLGPTQRMFWSAADEILVVTTGDSVAIMDTYAAIKLLAPGQAGVSLRLIVNQAGSRDSAGDVSRRIAAACSRFLGRSIGFAGHVPQDAAIPLAARDVQLMNDFAPGAAATLCLEDIAGTLAHGNEASTPHRPAMGVA